MTDATRAPRRRRADPIRADGVERDVLQERAEVLLRSVARQSNVTPELLAAHRPGGADNPDTSAMGWLSYLCQLHRWHATGPAQPNAKAALRWDAQAMEDLRAATAAEPVHTTLESGQQVAVHPKSDHALRRLAVGQVALQWTAERKLALLDAPTTPDVIRALNDACELETHLQAEFAWILTHAGADVPWDEEHAWDHVPPAWARELTPLDLLTLRRAHLEVNLLRLNSIASRTLETANQGEATPLAVFLGAMAAELQVHPEVFARKWSLGGIFATSLARAQAHDHARRAQEGADA